MEQTEKMLSVTVKDKHGRLYALFVRNPEWVPLYVEDIGKPCDPIALIEVKSESHELYLAP